MDLEKWSDQSKESVAKNVEEDNDHLRTDEADTAREAVAEGQAMVVFLDWGLAPNGQSLAKLPESPHNWMSWVADDGDSPVMARAPLLLQESLLFPYREGLNFEQVVLKDRERRRPLPGVLDRPPGTSYEIMHPRRLGAAGASDAADMPDIHPLIDAEYAPYDIGVMGALDVRILTELFGGQADGSAADAGSGTAACTTRRRAARRRRRRRRTSTKSVALLYLSQWKSEEAAARFAAMYAGELEAEVHGRAHAAEG